jgi:hypothetical protein
VSVAQGLDRVAAALTVVKTLLAAALVAMTILLLRVQTGSSA